MADKHEEVEDREEDVLIGAGLEAGLYRPAKGWPRSLRVKG